jgi:hypothetical protein
MPIKFTAAVFGVALSLCLPASAGAAASVQQFRTAADFTGAVLTCPTENVIFNGTATSVETVVVTPTQVRLFAFTTNLNGLTAVGVTSGTLYRVTGVTTGAATDAILPQTRSTTSTSIQTWLLIPEGGGKPLSFKETLKVTWDANGNLVNLFLLQPGGCN